MQEPPRNVATDRLIPWSCLIHAYLLAGTRLKKTKLCNKRLDRPRNVATDRISRASSMSTCSQARGERVRESDIIADIGLVGPWERMRVAVARMVSRLFECLEYTCVGGGERRMDSRAWGPNYGVICLIGVHWSSWYRGSSGSLGVSSGWRLT